MPFRFVLTNYNLTDDELIEFNKMHDEIVDRWTHEEVQMMVLGILLLVVIFAFLAIAGMDCFTSKCRTCPTSPVVVERKKVQSSFSSSPPPYTPPPESTRSITHKDTDPPRYSCSNTSRLSIS